MNIDDLVNNCHNCHKCHKCHMLCQVWYPGPAPVSCHATYCHITHIIPADLLKWRCISLPPFLVSTACVVRVRQLPGRLANHQPVFHQAPIRSQQEVQPANRKLPSEEMCKGTSWRVASDDMSQRQTKMYLHVNSGYESNDTRIFSWTLCYHLCINTFILTTKT